MSCISQQLLLSFLSVTLKFKCIFSEEKSFKLRLGVDMGRAVNDLYVECGCQKINCTASLIVSESSGYDHVSF